MILASFFSLADRFESYLVENPKTGFLVTRLISKATLFIQQLFRVSEILGLLQPLFRVSEILGLLQQLFRVSEILGFLRVLTVSTS